jgi:hypothetical protein
MQIHLQLLWHQMKTGSGMSADRDPYLLIHMLQLVPRFKLLVMVGGTYLWGDSTWGTARTVSDVILDPGNWSLDNFGQILIATISRW